MHAFARPSKAPPQNDEGISHRQRQDTISNRAEQGLSKAGPGEVEGDNTTAAIAPSGHDFSRIPVHPPARPTRSTANAPAPANAPARHGSFHGPAWTASSDRLWYFNGERNVSSNPTEVTLTAQKSHSGRFDWQVVAGEDKVEFVGGHDPGHAASQDDNHVRVRSRAGSEEGADDVRVRVAHLDGSGAVTTGEATLGVRTPSTMRAAGRTTATPAAPVAAFPDTDDYGAGVDEPEKQTTEDETRTAVALPQSAPSMTHKGATHSSHATFAYETHENYEVLDDKGQPMKGFDVNEKFTTSPTNDAAKCDWRRGAAGGVHAGGSTFFDNMQGEVSSKTPTPQNPQTPLGSTKVQHWTQEWYIGSTTPGKGTKVQTNTFQKYQDHAAHE
jgi:hypothetical protein